MNIKTTISERIKLGYVEKENAKTVTVHLTLPTTLDYKPEAVATALIFSDVLTAGAGTLSREDFTRTLNELGANIAVGITDLAISITVTTLKVKLNETLKLLTLMLTKATFAEVEIRRAKNTLTNLLELEKENARGIALANFRNSFTKNGDRLFMIEPNVLVLALKTVKRKDLQFVQKQILSTEATMTIGGDIESIKKVEIEIMKILTKEVLKIDQKILPKISQNKNQKRILKTASVPSKQNIELSIGSALPLTLTDLELPAFVFGLNVLGKWGGFAGRLMSTVREKEGLTYTIYTRTEGITTTSVGYWRILTFFAPKDVKQGITSTLREISNITKNGITELELKRFKTIIKTSEILTYDSLSNTTALVHTKLVDGLSWDNFLAFRTALDTCTRSEVNQALKKYLDPESLIISAAGPIKGLEKDLQSFVG